MASIIYVGKTDRRREFTSAVLGRFTRDLLVCNPRKVLVKPDISSYEPYPTTTHPDVLDAVLHFLERFHVHIYVGDGPVVNAGNSTELLQTHPLHSTCSTHNLDLLNLHSHGFTRVKTERGYTLNVSAVALDCDYIISLPVLKLHPRCVISGALNNQFGLFPLRDRLLMRNRFLKDIHRSIAEVNTIARPNIIIMDAVKTYINSDELRHVAQPTDLGYMLGGGDPVALDCYGLKLMSAIAPAIADKKPEDIDHLAWAIRVGAGMSDYNVHPAALR